VDINKSENLFLQFFSLDFLKKKLYLFVKALTSLAFDTVKHAVRQKLKNTSLFDLSSFLLVPFKRLVLLNSSP
jgi:hypothetical protein